MTHLPPAKIRRVVLTGITRYGQVHSFPSRVKLELPPAGAGPLEPPWNPGLAPAHRGGCGRGNGRAGSAGRVAVALG
jgi:hypothetical protein